MKRRLSILVALLMALALTAGALAEGLVFEDTAPTEADGEELFSCPVETPIGEEEVTLWWDEPAAEALAEETPVASEKEVQATTVGEGGGTITSLPGINITGEVVVADGVTVIADHAFVDYEDTNAYLSPCKKLTSVSLPSTVVRIGDYALSGCGTAEGFTINLPSSLVYIGTYAFSGSGLKSVEFPSSVVSVEDGVFSNCTRLTSAKLLGGQGMLGKNAFSGCTALPSIVIPDSVTYIGPSAFEGDTKLRAVQLPSGLMQMNARTFYGCSTLPSIKLPSTLTFIGESAFEKCYSLNGVSVPAGVTSIEDQTFMDCQAMSAISISPDTETIGDFAFYNCTSLRSLNGSGSVVLPDKVSRIGASAFSRCVSMTSLTIGEDIESIGEDAFNLCSQLQYITIKGHGNVGGKSAFDNIHPGAKFYLNCDLELDTDLEALGYTVNRTHGAIVEDEAVEPTCTEAGLTAGSHCADCDEIIVAQKMIPALGHTPVTDPAVPATYTSDGLTKGSHCSVCGQVLVKQETVPKLNRRIRLNKSGTKELVIGKKLQLKATVTPRSEASKLKWKSSNSRVASVSKAGLVKAKMAGQAVITAYLPDGKSASVTVSVRPPEIKSITLIRNGKKVTTATLRKGKSLTVKVKFNPKNSDSDIMWYTSNASVAGIMSSGNYSYKCKITAITKGTAVITAKSNNGKRAKINIKVK